MFKAKSIDMGQCSEEELVDLFSLQPYFCPPGLHPKIKAALGNEFIALEPIGPALWQIYFGPVTLGWFDEELFVIIDINGNTGRNPIC